MTMRIYMASGFAAMALLSGCGEASSGFEDGYKKQFVDSFGKSCQASAAGSAAPSEKIAEICKCTADALIAKYSPSELMGMKPEEAMPVMKECAAKSGLPV